MPRAERALKAVIFDFDGLILDTELPEFKSWCEVYQQFGHTLALETWAAAIGTRHAFNPYRFLEQLTGRPIDDDSIRSSRRRRFAELLLEVKLQDGVDAWLQEARRLGLMVGLASSSDSVWITDHLDRYGLGSSFDVMRCAGDGLRAKPEPDLYLQVLRDFGISADEAIALEDSPNGIAAAKAAGLYCIAVPNQMTASLDLTQADLVLPSLAATSISQLLARPDIDSR